MWQVSPIVDHFPYIGLLLLLFLGEIGFPFPEDMILILSGFLIAQGVTKWLPTLLVVYAGLLMTDFSLYLVGRKYGRKVVEHKKLQRIISPERLAKLEEKFKKWGVWVVLVGRHLLGVRAQIFLGAGVLRMPALKFLFADAISAVFTAGIMISIGYWGGDSIEALKKGTTRIEHFVVLAVVLLLVAGLVFSYFKSRQKVRSPRRE